MTRALSFVFNFFLFFFSNMYLRLASNMLFLREWPSDPSAFTSQELGLQAWPIILSLWGAGDCTQAFANARQALWN